MADAPDAPDPEVDRRRVRIGLGMLSTVVVVMVVLLAVVDDPLARTILSVLLATTLLRGLLLVRSLRRDRTGGGPSTRR